MTRKKKWVFDCEVYKNYLLIMFMDIQSEKIEYLQMHNGVMSGTITDRIQLKDFMENITSVGFNSSDYDNVICSAYMKRFNNERIKEVSDHIVTSGQRHWQTLRKFNLSNLTVDTIDIKEPAPGVMTSLKIYGGRANADKLQDLPIEPSAIITNEQADELRKYCVNDLKTTALLYSNIEKQIELREMLSEKYGVDMRSKSDAQIAEAIVKQYLEAEGVTVTKRVEPVRPFKYRVPEWVEFKTPEFQVMLERVRECTFQVSDKGSVVLPKELNKAVEYNGAKYKFGIGGLHSQEKAQVVIPKEDELLSEKDVASMYPSIIIEQELYPRHLTAKFLKVYADIKATRLKAKRSGDDVINKTYKIVLNGSYGKFGSKYSFLYSPELLIQTTITGQLSLLMLIEKVTLAGGKVVSANTDGVNVLRNKVDDWKVDQACFDWELTTGYELEDTPYLGTWNADVNNYLALKSKGIKGKGRYAVGGLMKNPTNVVCIEAIYAFLSEGKDIGEHIRAETDVTKFLTVRTVTGGAVFQGEDIGKAIRFYHSTNGDVITYKKNGNKVPQSDGCKPMMNLSSLPQDIDYGWYIENTLTLLERLGVK